MERDECDLLLQRWREVRAGNDTIVRAAALNRLASLSPDRLAILGLSDDDYARGWLEAKPMAASMAFSLLLLDAVQPVAAPDPILWHAMSTGDPSLAIPSGLLRCAATGHPLVRWLDRLAGTRPSILVPPDSHLGGWLSARTLFRLWPWLGPPGSDQRHDALRSMLLDLRDDDWVLMTTIW